MSLGLKLVSLGLVKKLTGACLVKSTEKSNMLTLVVVAIHPGQASYHLAIRPVRRRDINSNINTTTTTSTTTPYTTTTSTTITIEITSQICP